MKTKVFISFDYDNDFELKNALVAQAKNPDSPFTINDISIKQAIDSNWKFFAREKIRAADVAIFICGKHTSSAKGVTAEMSIVQEEKKPYFLLCGRPNDNVQKPSNAKSTDSIYKWNWENLKALIAGNR